MNPRSAPAATAPAQPWWRRVPWLTVAILTALLSYNILFAVRHDSDAAISPLVGRAAPVFALPVLDTSATRSLASSQGKVTLIDFWSTGCGPCKRELPSIAALRTELAGESFELLSVNVDVDAPGRASQIRQVLAQAGAQLPVLLDDGSASAQYSVSRIPMKVLVNRAGRVAKVYVGTTDEDQLRAQIAAELASGG